MLKVIKNIKEYDIQHCNISILAEKGLIDEELFLDLSEASKKERNELIGKMQIDDPDLTKILLDTEKEYLNLFIGLNKIATKNIVEMTKDSIFVKDTPLCKNLCIGEYIRFVMKNEYYLMIEFPFSDKSEKKVKIYLSRNGISSRFAKLDKKHSCTYLLESLLMYMNKDTKKEYNDLLRQFVKQIKTADDELIKGVDNKYLIEVFKSINV